MFELLLNSSYRPVSGGGPLPDSDTTAVGQQIFATSGTTSWTVPAGVFDICAVAVGSGGKGLTGTPHIGARGGDLRYVNRLKVTPGEVLTLIVGDMTGNDSKLLRGNTVLLLARGGDSTSTSTPINLPLLGGGNGGLGGQTAGTNNGGGGAGGYSGDGGMGGCPTADGQAGKGGGGGGGAGWSYNGNRYGAGGGGVGLYGEGTSGDISIGSTSGAGGTITQFGKAGSAGTAANGGTGGRFGGAAGMGSAYTPGTGGIRIIWGKGRSFPSALTADQTVVAG
ncbi:hypothetical protein FDH97_gp135 [Erwinia phage vB_EamM_Deimos-Minion]|uniref:Uncharacterized protein n=1 Tax=Erwinia phage vB_EamM_Deimos-Minion TaxID=1815986 RepID=A0A173GF64_9CAUD|nr:hypothetical protein FDH97_gp135 [Erwinia phage vB_EamM_Deimos-Minion]ANH52233.1 hypothetical protein DM_135 [Erwinia phage vB_EamM_Deimos-Minion]